MSSPDYSLIQWGLVPEATFPTDDPGMAAFLSEPGSQKLFTASLYPLPESCQGIPADGRPGPALATPALTLMLLGDTTRDL